MTHISFLRVSPEKHKGCGCAELPWTIASLIPYAPLHLFGRLDTCMIGCLLVGCLLQGGSGVHAPYRAVAIETQQIHNISDLMAFYTAPSYVRLGFPQVNQFNELII